MENKIRTKLDSEGVLTTFFVVPFLAAVFVGLIFLISLVGESSWGWKNYFISIGIISVLIIWIILFIMPKTYVGELQQKYIKKGVLPSWEEVNADIIVSFSEIKIPFQGEFVNLKEITDRMQARSLYPQEEELIIFSGSELFQKESIKNYQGRFLDEKTFDRILQKKPNFLFKLAGFNKKQLLQIIKKSDVFLLYGIETEGKENEYQKAFLDTNTSRIIFAQKILSANIFSLIWDFREDEEILEESKSKFSKLCLIPLN